MHRPLRALAPLPLLLAASTASAAIDARMLRYPDVSRDQVAFVYAGDIWVAPKAGGTAERLSTPAGEESFPRFSPDGSLIAFSGNYDGNIDIYVMPAGGGQLTRLTHHPAPDRVLDWTPDGKSILFATSMTSGKDRFNELYLVSKDGGLPEKLPIPYGEFGGISADGRTLAYTPQGREFATWKRYRGGWTSDIWLFGLQDHSSRNLTGGEANDEQPMWHGRTLYFLSDRGDDRRANIWARDLDTNSLRQVTRFTDYDCRFPAVGPDDIVFENGDRLWRLDLDHEKVHEVPVEVVTDRATLKPRPERVAARIVSASVSPHGKRVAFEARGDVFSVPAEHGPILDLTHSSRSAERFPAWSPDGKLLAYFTDRSGEYQLAVRPSDGSGSERQVGKLGPGFQYVPQWSPDSKKIAFVDQAMRIRVIDVATGKVTDVDKGLFMYEGDLEGFHVSWSADSRWMAYSRTIDSLSSALFLWDSRNAKLTQATSAFYKDSNPVFDPGGKYLYFLSSRSFRPSYSDLDNTWIYANTTNVAAIPLRIDVASPLAPRNDVEGKTDKEAKPGEDGEEDDEEKSEAADGEDHEKKPSPGDAKAGDAAGKKGEADDKEKDKEGTKKKPPKPVEIDLQGFEARTVVLPPPAGNYADLQAVAGKIVYRRLPRTGAPPKEKGAAYIWDLKSRKEKSLLRQADYIQVAAEGQKALVLVGKAWYIVEVKAGQKAEKRLATSDLEMTVDPVAEWHQIFDDAWRFERDFFYDPNMHGVDWEAMRKRYGSLLDDAVTRWDVNYVIGELIGELNSSHTYRGGGDVEHATQRAVGLLGCDYSLENGAYRIKRIVDGAPWDSEVRSPLRQPGVNVKEGDYLLAVNGVPLDTHEDPWAAFAGLAARTVTLTVNDKPTLDGARQVLVDTLKGEDRLRHLAWIEAKRRRVEERTKGRVAYVYVPDTGTHGQTELVRQYMGQLGKSGLIVDERFNSGGQIPDRFVEMLNRPRTNYWAVRDGRDWWWPPFSYDGPKAMLINGWSGSGGDAFPFYFREANLGPLIGMRTWGGLIGLSGTPGLVDGGFLTVPTFGIYSTEGKWIIEGHGVDPDIQVVDDPALMVDGGDPQLDAAIEEVLEQLEKNPPRTPARPHYTKR